MAAARHRIAVPGAAALPARVNAEFVAALHSPELRLRIEARDMDPTGLGVKAFHAACYAELKRRTKVGRDAGLKANGRFFMTVCFDWRK